MLLLFFIPGLKCGSHKSPLWPHCHRLRGLLRFLLFLLLPHPPRPPPSPSTSFPSLPPTTRGAQPSHLRANWFPSCSGIRFCRRMQGPKAIVTVYRGQIQVALPILQVKTRRHSKFYSHTQCHTNIRRCNDSKV